MREQQYYSDPEALREIAEMASQLADLIQSAAIDENRVTRIQRLRSIASLVRELGKFVRAAAERIDELEKRRDEG